GKLLTDGLLPRLVGSAASAAVHYTIPSDGYRGESATFMPAKPVREWDSWRRGACPAKRRWPHALVSAVSTRPLLRCSQDETLPLTMREAFGCSDLAMPPCLLSLLARGLAQ